MKTLGRTDGRPSPGPATTRSAAPRERSRETTGPARAVKAQTGSRGPGIDALSPLRVDWAAGIAARHLERAKHLSGFRSYFAESSPTHAKIDGLAGAETLVTFTQPQVSCIHRLYWSLPPDVPFEDLARALAKEPEFAKRKEPITVSQLERLFRRTPAAFPWSWPKRMVVATSYAVVATALEAPRGTSAAGVIDRLRERFPNAFDRKTIQDWTRDEWLRDEPRMEFLALLPRDERGRPVIQGLGADDEVKRAGGRMVLDQALADRVTALGNDSRVKWGWSVEQFVAFVDEQLGGGFTFNSYESLVGKKHLARPVPPWTVLKRLAMERLANDIAALHADPKRNITSTGEMSRVLHDELGYPVYDRTHYEYVRRYFPQVPNFKTAKSNASRDEAQALAAHLQGRHTKEHFQIARELGHDEERARYLVSIARAADPNLEPNDTATRRPYSREEIAAVADAVRRAPVGARTSEIYRILAREHPQFTAQRQLSNPRNIKYALSRYLGIRDISAHGERRLAELLAETARAEPAPKSFAQLVERARERHPIAYVDETIGEFRRRWAERPRPQAVIDLVDELGTLPWEALERPRYDVLCRELAAHFPSARLRPGPVAGLQASQTKLLHRLYWEAPPSADVDALLTAARQERPDLFADVTPRQVLGVFAAARDSFPWSMRDRGFVLHSFLLVEALTSEHRHSSLGDVIARLQRQHPGFPDASSFTRAIRGTWNEHPERFPFLARLPQDEQGRPLLAPATDEPRFARGKRLVFSEELAKRVRALCLGDEVRYDWSAADLREHLSRELDAPFADSSLIKLRREFPDIVPSYEEIRVRARQNFVALIRKLHDSGVDDRHALMDALHTQHGFPRYDPNLLRSLRAEFGDVLPSFRDLKTQNTLAEARAYLDLIKANPDRGIYELGESLGLSRQEIYYRLGLIHQSWPGEIQGAGPTAPYTDEDKRMLRDALDGAPMFATTQEVFDILRAESPAFCERHPLSSPATLNAVYRRELGIDWREYQHARLRAVVVHVAGRSGPGYPLRELFEAIRHEYDVRLSLQRFYDIAGDWRAHPERYPELAPLRDEAGLYPWERGRVPLSEDLAERVGAVLSAHPKWTVRQCVVHLMKDPAIAHRYPTLDEASVAFLRDAFPRHFKARADLGVKTEHELTATSLQHIADRILAVARERGTTAGLTPRVLARELDLGEAAILQALQRYPAKFPWSRPAQRAGLDLALAARIALTIEQAPPDATPADVIAALKRDAALAARYPQLDERMLDRAAEHYPDLVPSWDTRRRMLAAALVGQGSGELAAGSVSARASRLARETQLIPRDMPICRELAAQVKSPPFADAEIMCVQHMLGGQVPFFDLLRELGAAPHRTTLVGVPYSTNDTVVDVLTDRGWDVRSPPLDMVEWKNTVREALYERLLSALATNRRVVVLDDGGLVAELLDQDPFLRDHAQRFSLVEQTRRGITVAESTQLMTSVVNAAQSWGKVLEGALIGENLSQRLMLRLGRLGITSLEGVRVGLVGSGVIGTPLAQQLIDAGAVVSVREKDPAALARALELGCLDGTKDKEEFFGGQDIILTATGVRCIGPEELRLIPGGTILGQSSSKLVDIDRDALDALASAEGGRVEVIDGESHPPTLRYVLPDGRSIDLLASGFPISFTGEVNNLDVREVDLTHALMLIGMLQAVRAKVAGFKHLVLEPQRQVVERFAQIESVQEKHQGPVKLTQLTIERALENKGRADARTPKRLR